MTPQVRDFLDGLRAGPAATSCISGGTGSGQDDDAQRAVRRSSRDDERIVTIEDAAELQLHQEHVLRLESRPPNIEGRGEITIRDLVRNALRMRPDRIIVGEVRDGAALDMLQAMNTGHDGSITTVHANSPRDALSRLETMVLMAGIDLPVRAIREQVAERDRPDRAPGAAQGRHAPDHAHHRGRRHGGRRHHAAGPVRLRLPARACDEHRPLPRHAAADRPAAEVPRQAGRRRHPRARRSCSASRSVR